MRSTTLSAAARNEDITYDAPALTSFSGCWIDAKENAGGPSSKTTFSRPAHGAVVGITRPYWICPPVYDRSNPVGDAVWYLYRYRVVGASVWTEVYPARLGRTLCVPAVDLVRGQTYEWQCLNPLTAEWSLSRQFTVAADAYDFALQPVDSLLTSIAAQARPRILPPSRAATLTRFSPGGDLYQAITVPARAELDTRIGQALGCETNANTGTFSAGNALTHSLRMLGCYWLWRITGVGTYKTEAMRRWKSFVRTYDAGFSPATDGQGWHVGVGGLSCYATKASTVAVGGPYNGTTPATGARDIYASNVMIGIAMGYDLMRDDLAAQDVADGLAPGTWAARCVDALGYRLAEQMADARIGTFPLRESCLENSHGIGHICTSALCASILLGDPVAVASSWYGAITGMAEEIDEALLIYHGFQGADGLHWSGYTYSGTVAGMLGPLEMLADIARVDRAPHPATAGLAWSYITCYPMCRAPLARPFGDATTTDPIAIQKTWAALLPAAAPYAGRTFFLEGAGNSFAGSSYWMYARSTPASIDCAPINAGLYPDGGQAVWHSDWHDVQRVSDYCRSSESGGFNHRDMSHNAYCIIVRGRYLTGPSFYYQESSVPLAGGGTGTVATGTRYGGEHWSNCSKNSWFHNSVSINGQAGVQRWDDGDGTWETSDASNVTRRSRGRIVAYRNRTGYGYCVMDAVRAYQSPSYVCTKALRAVVVIKPGVRLVFDAFDLSSGSYTWHQLWHTAVQSTLAAGVITFRGLQCGAVTGSRTGTGYLVDALVPRQGMGVIETWTLTALSATSFSVVGSVSGAQANATVGTEYVGRFLQFTLKSGPVAFVAGDAFIFTIEYVNDGNARVLYGTPAAGSPAETVNDNSWPTLIPARPSDPNGYSGDTATLPAFWHNRFNRAAGGSLRMCTLINVAGFANTTAQSCSASGSVMTASLTVGGRAWTVAFDSADGSVSVT